MLLLGRFVDSDRVVPRHRPAHLPRWSRFPQLDFGLRPSAAAPSHCQAHTVLSLRVSCFAASAIGVGAAWRTVVSDLRGAMPHSRTNSSHRYLDPSIHRLRL